MNDIWYFAYGRNLDKDEKTYRTQRIREARKCVLKNYKFIFAKTKAHKPYGNADIVKSEGDEVQGVIYRMTPAALRNMDRFEGVDSDCYKRLKVIVNVGNDEVHAVAYDIVDKSHGFCSPTLDYLNHIIKGLRQHGFSENVVRTIKEASGLEFDGSTLYTRVKVQQGVRKINEFDTEGYVVVSKSFIDHCNIGFRLFIKVKGVLQPLIDSIKGTGFNYYCIDDEHCDDYRSENPIYTQRVKNSEYVLMSDPLRDTLGVEVGSEYEIWAEERSVK